MRAAWIVLIACGLASASLAESPDLKARTSDLPLASLEVRPQHELWIRVKPAHAGEARDVMREVATRYRETAETQEPVTVVLLLGGRPLAREVYSPAAPAAGTTKQDGEPDAKTP